MESKNTYKISSPFHLFEISERLESGGKLSERGETLQQYLETHTATQILLSLKEDPATKHKFLNMYNEEICRRISEEDLESVIEIMEKLSQLYKKDPTITLELKGAFFNNFAAYYEKIGDLEAAVLMLDEAIATDKAGRNSVAEAVDCNNKTVILLSLQRPQEAYKTVYQALIILEPIVFGLISLHKRPELEKSFNQKLFVLLMVYYNLGITYDFLEKSKEAFECFEQGTRLSIKYLGKAHSFVSKFQNRQALIGMPLENQKVKVRKEQIIDSNSISLEKSREFSKTASMISSENIPKDPIVEEMKELLKKQEIELAHYKEIALSKCEMFTHQSRAKTQEKSSSKTVEHSLSGSLEKDRTKAKP